MTPDNPNPGTSDEPLASLDAAMDAWNDEPEEQDQLEADNPPLAADDQGEGDPEPDPEDFSEPDGQSEPDEEQPGPDELVGGQFAPHNAKVKLPDGRVTTVEDLLGGSMMLGDYRQKTAEVARERETYQAEQTRLKSLDTELQSQREIIMALAEQMAPKRPDPSLIETDLATFTLQERAYQAFQDSLKQLGAQMEGHRGRQTKEMQAKRQNYLQSERARLEQVEPKFKDQKWRDGFFKAAEAAGQYYGYTPEEFYSLTDHRHFLIIRDALAYRRGKQEAARASNGQQPQRTLNGQRRPGNVNAQKQQAAKARFTKQPTLRNAVDLLPD